MKKLFFLFLAGLLLLVIGCQKDSLFDIVDPVKDPVKFRNGVDIEALIDGGVAWMVSTQQADGSFSTSNYYERVAYTGLAVTKLCDRTIEKGYANPLDPAGPYYNEITAGLDYIFSKAIAKAGGYILTANSGTYHETYNTAIGLMAICASRNPNAVVSAAGPVNGKTYFEVAQGVATFFVNSQNPDGGWRYYDTNEPSDQSNTGYVVLALSAAQNFGCEVPQALKTALSVYIDYTQNDVNGDANDGGCGYTDPNGWVNCLKTGNILFEMAFVGDPLNPPSTRITDALDYLVRHWYDNNTDPGWRIHFQAMYTIMKGLVATNVDELTGGIDWYTDFVTAIDQTKQGSPGNYYWPSNVWGDEFLSTAFSLLTLEKIVALPYQEVEFDIKPTSCPNPFNMNSKGVLPVAILGTADFDVSQIDISTVQLEGVNPVHSSMQDVTAPVVDPQTDCACTTAGPDGFVDLTFNFSTQALVANAPALQGVSDGDEVVMTITGQTIDGQQIIGTDCVVILKKK